MASHIDPALPLADNFSRLVCALSGEVAEHLDAASADHARALHQARKAIKRLRALLLLFRSAAPRDLKRCDGGFRDAARAIAGPREATALVETMERLIDAYPERIVEARLGEIRACLIRRSAMPGETDTFDRQIALARAAACKATSVAFRADMSCTDAGTIHHGLRKTVKNWSAALDRARATRDPDAFHDLRKAVKAHAAQLALLEAAWPAGCRKRRKAVDALGEALGDLNDIHVMLDSVRHGALCISEDVDTGAFTRLLRKEVKRLSRRALSDAEKLLAATPGGLGKHLRGVFVDQSRREAA